MKNKVWKKLFMGSLMISAMAVPAQTAVGIQAEEETATLAENETDFQMLFDEAVKDAMIIDADEVLPVASLAKGQPYAVYDEEGRILLYTFHK